MIQFIKTAAANTRAAVSFYLATLVAINAYIVRELFRTEYTVQMHSIEGTYMAISRVLMEQPSAVWSWWPYWFCGIPFGNTYFPLLHIVDAVVARLAGVSPALAYHAVSATMYCLGPVALFFLVWRMAKSPGLAFVSAMAYELVSPSLWLIPEIVLDTGTPWNARRYQTLVAWGEGPHVVALTIVPIALLLLQRVLEGKRRFVVPASAAMGAAMLTSAFGITTMALGGLCLVLAAPTTEWKRRAAIGAAMGVLVYLLISPLMPPSVLLDIRANSEFMGGGYKRTLPNTLAGVGIAVWVMAVRWTGLRLDWPEHVRFFAVFSALFSSFPLLAYHAHLYAIPQPQRYHLQAEMGLIPLAVFGLWALVRRSPKEVRVAVAIALLCCVPVQVRHYRRYAKWLNLGIDMSRRVEYKIARWLDQNLAGERVMASGSVDTWLNVFASNPQLHGGHDPMSPAPKIRHAVFAAFYGAPEAPMWLRAFGVRALTVHGPLSEEFWKPFKNPKAYEGVLPVLWREGDDTIYGVPGRSASLAHVVPANGPVEVEEGGGINRDSLTRFAKLLDDPGLGEASFQWEGMDRAVIRAPVVQGQVVSVQVTWHRGWKATVAGRPVPVRADGLGLMVIEPGATGDVEIHLTYTGGAERTVITLASVASLLMLGLIGFSRLGRDLGARG